MIPWTECLAPPGQFSFIGGRNEPELAVGDARPVRG
jgi:hypothetical protein